MRHLSLDPTDLTWLAGLARALLREPHAAEDLVQETVVAALESDPPASSRRRPWLASVARRLAARRYRGDARRARREQRVARPEATPDSATLVERAEVAEQVVAVARRLPEPFRRTILLRFLEGLTTEEIARREGRPPDTVRHRVRRGLELMREELMRHNRRDWSSMSILLLPLARISGTAGLATAGAGVAGPVAVTAMNTKLMTFLGAVALCGGGVWFAWSTTSDPQDSESVTRRDPTEGLVASSVAKSARTGVAAELERAEVSTARGSDEPESGFTGSVVDRLGRPIVGATVYLVPPSTKTTKERQPNRPVVLARVATDEQGTFLIPFQFDDGNPAGIQRVDLGVVANGYVRRMVRDAARDRLRERLRIVLERGRRLSGIVVDELGRPVRGLSVLAHSARASIDHVSPSQTLLRADRSVLGDAASIYGQCRARTNDAGTVVFQGLPKGDLAVRSLDPGWKIQRSKLEPSGGRFMTWTARRCLGVRVSVVDSRTKKPVARASAVFRAELTFRDGTTEDYGQWVGRGVGGASFLLDAEVLPQLRDLTVIRAVFYGTVGVGGASVPWRAVAIEDPRRAVGVAEVKVDVDVAAKAKEVAWPMADVELDVRYPDAGVFRDRLAVSWVFYPDQGRARKGDAKVEKLTDGRYRAKVPAGDVKLRVADARASGSLTPWIGRVRSDPARTARASVTLPRGAMVTISRPTTWTGEWFVRASFRGPGTDEWRGAWEYSTRAATLELAALRPAEWRFQLRCDADRSGTPLVRIVDVVKGERIQVR